MVGYSKSSAIRQFETRAHVHISDLNQKHSIVGLVHKRRVSFYGRLRVGRSNLNFCLQDQVQVCRRNFEAGVLLVF